MNTIPADVDPTAVHPFDCRCLPCRADAEFFDYVARMEVCECEIDWKCGVCRHGEVAR